MRFRAVEPGVPIKVGVRAGLDLLHAFPGRRAGLALIGLNKCRAERHCRNGRERQDLAGNFKLLVHVLCSPQKSVAPSVTAGVNHHPFLFLPKFALRQEIAQYQFATPVRQIDLGKR
jgi:hypothetical protein